MPDEHHAGFPPGDEPSNGDDRLTPEDVARLTGHTVRTIGEYRSSRNRSYGPPFHREGRIVFYRLSEVLTWMDGRSSTRPGRRPWQ